MTTVLRRSLQRLLPSATGACCHRCATPAAVHAVAIVISPATTSAAVIPVPVAVGAAVAAATAATTRVADVARCCLWQPFAVPTPK